MIDGVHGVLSDKGKLLETGEGVLIWEPEARAAMGVALRQSSCTAGIRRPIGWRSSSITSGGCARGAMQKCPFIRLSRSSTTMWLSRRKRVLPIVTGPVCRIIVSDPSGPWLRVAF